MSAEIEAFGRKWKRVWQEDDATRNDPTAEHMRQAWKRLFNEEYPGSKEAPEEDHGDTFYYLFADRMYVMAYDGDSIYVPADALTLAVPVSGRVSDGGRAPTRLVTVSTDADPYTAMAREFHQRMGLVVRDAPSLGTPAEREERVRLMLEELLELAESLAVDVYSDHPGPLHIGMLTVRTSPHGQADAEHALRELADFQVTVSGTAAQFGLRLLAAVRAVHAANMQKTPQGPGCKPLKPAGWKPADVSRVLSESGGGES